jgi:hypothetical protein
MTGPYDSPYDNYEGVDDEHWLTQDGLYPQAIMAMICRLTSAEDDNDCPVAGDDGNDGDDEVTYLLQAVADAKAAASILVAGASETLNSLATNKSNAAPKGLADELVTAES